MTVLVIVDKKVFVTNLAMPLAGALGDEPEEDIAANTRSRSNVTDIDDDDHGD